LNQIYEEFGKTTLDVLVELRRGALASSFSFPPVNFRWHELCHDSPAKGEGEYSYKDVDPATSLPVYAMGMPNAGRTVEFTPPCPALAWSGKLLQDQFFSVRKSITTGDQLVKAAVLNVEDTSDDSAVRNILRIGVEYRMILDSGFTFKWRGFAEGLESRLATTDDALYTGDWAVTDSMADGKYEIRVVAECTDLPTGRPSDSFVTPSIFGIVDRTAPELLSFTTTSLSNVYATGDHFILTFSEAIVCTGFLDDQTRAVLRLQIDFDGVASYSVGNLPGDLDFSCEDSVMRVAAPLFDTAVAASIAARPTATLVQVTIVSGLFDRAGNAVANMGIPVPLTNGRAGEERQALQRGVNGVHAEVSALDRAVGANLTALVSQSRAETNRVVDRMDLINTTLTNTLDTLSAKSDAASIEMQRINGSIADLTGLVTRLLVLLPYEQQGAPSATWPVCNGKPATYLFARYIRGVLATASSKVGGTFSSSAECAAKCLADPQCTGYSFVASTLSATNCLLGATTSWVPDDLDSTVRSAQYYRRLTIAQKPAGC